MQKSYATFGFVRSLHQVSHALKERNKATGNTKALLDMVRLEESRIYTLLGEQVRDKKILEIGPGQGLDRATYYGRQNDVFGLDLDVIPHGYNPADYVRMWRKNGLGRVAKTIGRKVILEPKNRENWANAMGVRKLHMPRLMQGDICTDTPPGSPYDICISFSVWEHLPDPRAALQNIIDSLRPGGVFYISLHLYTSNNGHHDIRSFTGKEDQVPLWGHLREATKDGINPSSWLNEWRLDKWRDLFNELAPGHTEYLEQYEHPEVFGPKLVGPLKEELADYSEDELLTVNLVYGWQKPK